MSDCPTTEWCRDSFTMLKHPASRPRTSTCDSSEMPFSNWTHLCRAVINRTIVGARVVVFGSAGLHRLFFHFRYLDARLIH